MFEAIHRAVSELSLGGAVILVSTALLLVLAIIYNDRLLFVSKSKDVPMVSGGLPLVGHLKWLLDLAARRVKFLDEMVEFQRTVGKGGRPFSISFPALGGKVTVINRPEYIKWCQKTNFPNYIKGDSFRESMGDVMGIHGIFVADGEPWKRQRKMASHIFSVGNFRTHVQSAIQKDLTTMKSLLNDVSQRGTQVNLADVFFRFTLSSFSQMAFSADIKCLPAEAAGLNEVVEFAAAFDYAQQVMENRFFELLGTFMERFNEKGRNMRKATDVLHSFCYKIIDLRLAARREGTVQGAVSSKGDKDLLALFMDMGLERDELLPVVLNFLIAGRDTTAQSLAWLFYEFALHPEWMEKCRQEAIDYLGKGDTARLMGYDDLSALTCMHACFYEAIRLHPAVPKNVKKVVKDDVIRPYAQGGDEKDSSLTSQPGDLPDIVVKKGESVAWSDYGMARMPEIWGEDCLVYNPERFIETRPDGTKTIKTYSQYKFHAFNAGPRLCLGQTLATYEGVAVMAVILSDYNVLFDHEALRRDPPTYADSLTHPLVNPYTVRFEKRE
ncbi:cytochrome P450 [Violaceomyces palustris]|uniref:Cytochrome P450 n=1 Tax=Violaceomyces palustris TaxID=1673888 RepID=A0ACD0P501_9BASI|nr:cytochrome P450 [Violaceomyces palustris]